MSHARVLLAELTYHCVLTSLHGYLDKKTAERHRGRRGRRTRAPLTARATSPPARARSLSARASTRAPRTGTPFVRSRLAPRDQWLDSRFAADLLDRRITCDACGQVETPHDEGAFVSPALRATPPHDQEALARAGEFKTPPGDADGAGGDTCWAKTSAPAPGLPRINTSFSTGCLRC